jgi:hypothetical protein
MDKPNVNSTTVMNEWDKYLPEGPLPLISHDRSPRNGDILAYYIQGRPMGGVCRITGKEEDIFHGVILSSKAYLNNEYLTEGDKIYFSINSGVYGHSIFITKMNDGPKSRWQLIIEDINNGQT